MRVSDTLGQVCRIDVRITVFVHVSENTYHWSGGSVSRLRIIVLSFRRFRLQRRGSGPVITSMDACLKTRKLERFHCCGSMF